MPLPPAAAPAVPVPLAAAQCSTTCPASRSAASTCCRRTPHDLPDHKLESGKSPIERSRRLCGLHLLEPGKSLLYTQAPSCVKRPHIANQMKRVQGANGSLAQSGARSPSVLPAENAAKPIGSRNTHPHRAADSVLRPPRPPSGSPPENAQFQSEPANPDNRTADPRTHEWRSRPAE